MQQSDGPEIPRSGNSVVFLVRFFGRNSIGQFPVMLGQFSLRFREFTHVHPFLWPVFRPKLGPILGLEKIPLPVVKRGRLLFLTLRQTLSLLRM